MRDRRTVTLLGALVVVLAVAGCSETRAGTPSPGSDTTTGTSAAPNPSTPSTSGGSADRHGAPSVDNPLDAARYLTQPCTAISPRLLQSLGLPGQGEPNTTGAIGSRAPSCDWRAGAELVHVAFLKANKNGLADLYRGHASRPEAYWEETKVGDYPGVFHSPVDSRSDGQCDITVGLSDQLAMSVRESGRLGARSCERAKNVAEAVIQTLRGRG